MPGRGEASGEVKPSQSKRSGGWTATAAFALSFRPREPERMLGEGGARVGPSGPEAGGAVPGQPWCLRRAARWAGSWASPAPTLMVRGEGRGAEEAHRGEARAGPTSTAASAPLGSACPAPTPPQQSPPAGAAANLGASTKGPQSGVLAQPWKGLQAPGPEAHGSGCVQDGPPAPLICPLWGPLLRHAHLPGRPGLLKASIPQDPAALPHWTQAGSECGGHPAVAPTDNTRR